LPVKSSTAGARRSSGYSAYLEALTPDSRVDIAVRIAADAGVPIKVAGKLRSRGDKASYRQKLAPSLRHPHVAYVGEVEELQKQDLWRNACALLMPGKEQVIAMEAINVMAVSTPVIAFEHGPASEVVQDRISGFVVADEPQAVAAIQRSFDTDRSRVRGVLEQCFCSAAVATQYLRIYERLSIRKRYPLRLSARARLHEFLAHSFVSQGRANI
jgi:glycosyltransferase involved in cell wall biosynthesis